MSNYWARRPGSSRVDRSAFFGEDSPDRDVFGDSSTFSAPFSDRRNRIMEDFDNFRNRHPMSSTESPFSSFRRRTPSWANETNTSRGSTPAAESSYNSPEVNSNASPFNSKQGQAKAEPSQSANNSREGTPDSRTSGSSYCDSERSTDSKQPKVHHIPIYVEPRTESPTQAPPTKAPPTQTPPRPKSTQAAPRSTKSSPVPPKETTVPVKVVHEEIKPTKVKNDSGKNLSILNTIRCATNDLEKLKTEIDKFSGRKDSKQYMYLDEMLTRILIRLDDIETNGNEELRLLRKEAILAVQGYVQLIESKASANEVEKMEADSTSDAQAVVSEADQSTQEMAAASQEEEVDNQESSHNSSEPQLENGEKCAANMEVETVQV